MPWVPSLFPGFMEVQHVVGASREGDSMVHWLLPVPILQVLVKVASTGGSDSESGIGIYGT